MINITVSKYHCINPIWYKFLIFWIVSKNFRWYKKYCFCLTKYFLIQKYLYQKNLRKIWWYKKYLYQKYFLWRIVIQIFSRMGDTNFSNFVSPKKFSKFLRKFVSVSFGKNFFDTDLIIFYFFNFWSTRVIQ